ncbi:uncharacterized protein LOC109705413 [Ananas comosus]|uniref:Uncharacterized protein LOC109705413 n=1 Tax=Ananas comosus TaxID=4615 RepID=A0A6P5EEB7_ANACO|nr:uncharacterized protein LOC109705413 [Ananas comosus]
MKNKVKEARDCYSNLDVSESSDFKDDKSFAEMLLLDSYFILFTLTIKLRKGLTHYTLTPLTPKFTKKPLMLFQYDHFKFLDIIFNKDEIALDLLIFDNQIPFFVIKDLFKEFKSKKPLHEYALEFFKTIHPRSARHCMDKNISPPKFLHLLDLFHWSRVPKNKYIELSEPCQRPDSIHQAGLIPNVMKRKEHATATEKKKPQQLDSIYWARHTPNAVELRESATMFEKKTSGSSLDVTFQGRRFTPVIRVLNIPELHIRDYSSLIFHNLIAFEIQASRRGRCTMAFSALMQNLLQTEEDVKLLRRSGILASSSMTDSQLIDLFECLSRLTENHQMPSELCAICHQVQSYHNYPMSRFCGSVITRYFPSPLVTLTVFGAILLFIPTLLQTIYTML